MPQPLSDASPAELCLRLGGQSASGVLRLDGPRGRAHIRLRRGEVVAARAPGMLSGRTGRLGERLMTAGKLDRPDLEAALSEQRDSGDDAATVGELLVQRGLAAPDHVRLAVQEQMLEGLLEIMAWYEGTWEFEAGDGESPSGVSVAIPVERALMEVRRRLAERDRVQRLVPSPTSVPRPVPDVTAPSTLAPDEFAMLTSLDGLRSVGTIAGELGFGYDEASRLVYRLILQGLAELADGTPTHDHEEPPVPEPRPATAAPPPSPRLEDQGWADLRQSSGLDGPEPWVGWANGAPAVEAEPDEAARPPEPGPDPEPEPEPWLPPPEPERRPAVADPPHDAIREPAAETAPAEHPEPEPYVAGPSSLDADTRRLLFSELRDVSTELPQGGPPAAPTAPEVEPEPEPEAEPEPDVAAPEPPQPTPAPSGSDVSELLRELHALSMDEPEPPPQGGGGGPARSAGNQEPDDDGPRRRRFGR